MASFGCGGVTARRADEGRHGEAKHRTPRDVRRLLGIGRTAMAADQLPLPVTFRDGGGDGFFSDQPMQFPPKAVGTLPPTHRSSRPRSRTAPRFACPRLKNGLRLLPHQGLKGKFDDHNQALVDWIDRDRHAHNVRRGSRATRHNNTRGALLYGQFRHRRQVLQASG